MTKFLTKAALAATVATGLFASPALAADTEAFTATARIVSPLTLTNVNDLNFGTITKLPGLPVAGQAVVVGRSGGSAATSCGANLLCTTPTVASFNVSGSIGQGLTVTTSAVTSLGRVGGGGSVAFAADAPGTVALAGPGVGAGTASFEIGGSITVSSATPDGSYTADVDVTVEYS